MPNNQDPLSQLWQQQEVQKPDYQALQTSWDKMRVKQKLYVFFDVLSVLMTFFIIWFNKEKLDDFTLSLMTIVLLIAIAAVFYLTWLRRFSLGWSNQNTAMYLQQLKKQLENNIKIANLSMHSGWAIIVLLVFFYAGLYIYEAFPLDQLLKKIYLTLAIHSLLLPGIWFWAKKRKQRFVKELAELNKILEL
ncbi:hypothetical protein [uncultured Paraglaciecola sp.]|uniref:hypothetical protein n=1 Tax=uncultured Paraglaciecola sp. TaxID=1765024 RepID=UPI002596CFFB|nr:hypothetical protein [uncultured Paraglaciecola sp.]